MKLLLILIPFTCLVNKAPAPATACQDFHFELTVNSTSEDTARFDLLVTGVTLTQHGDPKPFRVQYRNLKTPYKLTLEEGKYTAVVETKYGAVFSKVQGIRNGDKMGYTSGSQRITTMSFESLGN